MTGTVVGTMKEFGLPTRLVVAPGKPEDCRGVVDEFVVECWEETEQGSPFKVYTKDTVTVDGETLVVKSAAGTTRKLRFRGLVKAE
jgi:hypothetical protein